MHPLRIDGWEIWSNFHRSSLGPRERRYAPIQNFSARRYIALTAIVKVGIRNLKTAQNEQVCAHQKSYRK